MSKYSDPLTRLSIVTDLERLLYKRYHTYLVYTTDMKAQEKILIYLRLLHETGKVDSYDESLQERVECGQKQILRDMRTLARSFDQIAEIKEGKRIIHKLVKPIDILSEAFRNSDVKLGILFELAREGELHEVIESLRKLSLQEKKPYMFVHNPFEDIDTFENSSMFVSLKSAVLRKEYRTIELKGGKRFRNIKPLKLLFSEGNWYIAYLDDKELRISRLSFLKHVTYGSKNNYSPKSVEDALTWLEKEFQNPFSRYGKERKEAVLIARPAIAHYFDAGMKRFFKTQRFIEKLDNGSVRFGIGYTQEMEILPFVQKWMPDLLIESPKELKEAYKRKLKEALEQNG